MTVRQATLDDLPIVTARAEAFHAYSPYRTIPIDDDALEGFLTALIEGGGIFLTDTGFCGGTVVPAYFNPDFLMAAELFWHAPQGGGRELREAFEAWGKAQGCFAVTFSAMTDEHLPVVSRIYRRAGFRQGEVSFVKDY